uniref:Uncharacterized protein n=1 Tax=Avena sativa TaxID=4498 RepID=A0ACD5XA30_AVESA
MASSKVPRPRAEASAPATSVAVAAARAQDARPLQRSAAFQTRRTHHARSHSHIPHPQRCDSERMSSRSRQPRCGEVAGGTAAGCAAVCFCIPCVMVEVVVLATVRAPAALCRRAVKASRRRRSASAGQAADIYELLGAVPEEGDAAAVWPEGKQTEESGEKEVWEQFYGAGFWRSPSQLGDEIR